MIEKILQERLEIKQTGTMPENYVEALIKLIPSLILGLYIALCAVIPINSLAASIVVAVIGVAATPVFIIFVQQVKLVSQIVISSISMLAYVLIMQPMLGFFPENYTWIPVVAVITWTFFAPFFYIKSKNE